MHSQQGTPRAALQINSRVTHGPSLGFAVPPKVDWTLSGPGRLRRSSGSRDLLFCWGRFRHLARRCGWQWPMEPPAVLVAVFPHSYVDASLRSAARPRRTPSAASPAGPTAEITFLVFEM